MTCVAEPSRLGPIRRTPRRLTAGIIGAALLMSASFPVGASSRCGGEGFLRRRRPAGHGWTYVMPQLRNQDLTSLAAGIVNPKNPRSIYLAYSSVVAHTRDGGCTWASILDLDQVDGVGITSGARTIVGMALRAQRKGTRLFVLLHGRENRGNISLLTKAPHESAWEQVSDPDLPLTGTAAALESAPGGDVIYVAAASSVPYEHGINSFSVSEDGGRQWERRMGPLPVVPGTTGMLPEMDFLVDDRDPNVVWAWSDDNLWRSDDAARSWKPIDLPGDPIIEDVVASSDNRAVATCGPERCLATTDDTGRSWKTLVLPEWTSVTSGFFHPRSSGVLVGLEHDPRAIYGTTAPHSGAWRIDPSRGWVDLRSPFPPAGFAAAATPGAPLIIWNRGGSTLAEYSGRW